MGGGTLWRKALILSALLHAVLFASVGWLAPFAFSGPQAVEYIEMELADNSGEESGALKVQPPVRQPLPADPAAAAAPAAGGAQTTAMNAAATAGNGLSQGPSDSGGADQVVAAIDGGQPAEGQEKSAIRPARVSLRTALVYPEEAKRQGLEGVALVSVEVLANGRAGEVGIAESSGEPLLDAAAIRTVRQWKFDPAQDEVSGVPVASTKKVEVTFRLHNIKR